MRPRHLLVTPSYPTATAPWSGVDVREQVLAAAGQGIRLTVVHLASNPVDVGSPGAAEICEVEAEEGTIRRLGVPVASVASATDAASTWADTLRAHAWDLITGAAVAHAYGGLTVGAAVAAVAPDDCRLVVTEPADELAETLDDAADRASYTAVLQRASACLVPTRQAAGVLTAALGEEATRAVQVAPPVVRTDRFHARAVRPRVPRRWLHVGDMTDAAGLDRIARAFAAYRRVDGEAVLTLVGEGGERSAVAATVDRLGVADHVRFVPPVAPDQLVPIYLDSDVLVHVPRYEAFGVCVLEAAAAGLGVVVTRCGGPEETLDDVAALGGVRFVPPGDDVVPVLEAVHDLAATFDAVLPGADRLVGARFGPTPAGLRLARAYGDDVAPSARRRGSEAPWPRVLLVDLDGRGGADLQALAVTVSDLGGQAVVVTAGGAPPAPGVPGVLSVDLRTIQDAKAGAAATRAPRWVRRPLRAVGGRLDRRAGAADVLGPPDEALFDAALSGPLAGIGEFQAAAAFGAASTRLAAAVAPETPVLAPTADALVRHLATRVQPPDSPRGRVR